MVNRMLCLVGLLALSAAARAGTCEDDFEAVGDPRNGMLFMGQVQKSGLSVSSALGQMQKIAQEEGYQIGNESITGNSGELLFTQTNLRTPLVWRVQADSSGQVSLGTKLARGQKMEVAGARTEICSMLAKLKAGKEGEAIAAAARTKTGAGQVIDAEAPKLSAEIGRDIQKTMAGVNSKGVFGNLLIGSSNYATDGERNEAFAPIVAKYKGRKYRIDGQIYTVSENRFSGEMEVAYLVTQTRGLLAIRQSSSDNNNNFTIQCILAPDQAKFFTTLANGDWVKLAGTVNQIGTHGMVLRDCRQAN
jgi:hypothetical protein